jgi:co-chaperonin GroES (HSP10)|tara:strand:+ start:3602 stop:4030 length:429 start_codon:yes stop_codon:yes gene_type:complete
MASKSSKLKEEMLAGPIADELPTKPRIVTSKLYKKLPEPSGYRILVGLPQIEVKTEGGIIKPDEILATESMSTVIGFVIKMGPDCYLDRERFPTGTYCKEGDFVLIRAFQGTRFKVHGEEFRIINDDNVEAVVDDPRGYSRA